MDDLIKRQDAILAVEWSHTPDSAISAIKSLPSVQTEIIRCKDCKYWEKEGTKGMCNDLYGYGRYWNPDDFCSYAERRTDD